MVDRVDREVDLLVDIIKEYCEDISKYNVSRVNYQAVKDSLYFQKIEININSPLVNVINVYLYEKEEKINIEVYKSTNSKIRYDDIDNKKYYDVLFDIAINYNMKLFESIRLNKSNKASIGIE